MKSADMPAELGTRKGATLKDVNMESTWQNGFEWMRLNESEFLTMKLRTCVLQHQKSQMK